MHLKLSLSPCNLIIYRENNDMTWLKYFGTPNWKMNFLKFRTRDGCLDDIRHLS